MRRLKIAAAVAAAAALLVVPSTVHAQKSGALMEAEPNSGFPGDSFNVHNLQDSECYLGQVVVTVDGPAPFGNESATINDVDGDWDVDFTVPPGSAPGPYPINAECQFDPQDRVELVGKGFAYAPVTYTVLAQEPSPSPDPSPSPSEDPDVGAEREEAPAAQPEVEAAAFTG